MKFEELAAHFQTVKENSYKTLSWYTVNRKRYRRYSKLIRFCSVTLAGIGGVMPLLQLSFSHKEYNLINFGYVAFSLAASLFLLDRFFGFSTGWMRFMLTEVKISNIISAKLNDWVIYELKHKNTDLSDDTALELIAYINDMANAINELTLSETQEWINEFKSANQSLEQLTNNKKNR